MSSLVVIASDDVDGSPTDTGIDDDVVTAVADTIGPATPAPSVLATGADTGRTDEESGGTGTNPVPGLDDRFDETDVAG